MRPDLTIVAYVEHLYQALRSAIKIEDLVHKDLYAKSSIWNREAVKTTWNWLLVTVIIFLNVPHKALLTFSLSVHCLRLSCNEFPSIADEVKRFCVLRFPVRLATSENYSFIHHRWCRPSVCIHEYKNGDEYYNQDKFFFVIAQAKVWDNIISHIKIATIANWRSFHGTPVTIERAASVAARRQSRKGNEGPRN